MWSDISQILSRTVETADPSESFAPSSPADIAPVTVSDGQGGTLTAVAAIRNPSADGHGALVFFWHNSEFLGWDGGQEAMTTYRVVASGPGDLAVTYANYAANDALCCPSLAPVTIIYRWDRGRLQPNEPVPPGVYALNGPYAHPVTVELH